MKSGSLGILLGLSVVVSGCGKGEDAAPEPAQPSAAPTEATLSETVQAQSAPARAGDDPATAAYWTGPKYKIKKVPDTHQDVPHLVLHGHMTLVAKADGTYTVETEDYDGDSWPAGWGSAVLKWNEGTEYCPPPPARPKSTLDAAVRAFNDEMKSLVKAVTSDDKRKFVGESVELHEENDGHKLHRIVICPIDPDRTDEGKSGVLIYTYSQAGGGGHDGISHGEG